MVRTLKVSVERKTFLDEVGWLIEQLTKAIEMKSYMGFNKKYRGKFSVHLMESVDEGPRRGGLVPVGRWTRAVVSECNADCVNWVERKLSFSQNLRLLKIEGGITVQLRRWSPKENLEVEGSSEEVGFELRGLPFHLYLNKARVRISMKERSVLPALIKVTDGDWVFTISVAVIGAEDVRRGRVMGESTQEVFCISLGNRWRKAIIVDNKRTNRSRASNYDNSDNLWCTTADYQEKCWKLHCKPTTSSKEWGYNGGQ
ncbi:hypothetical protein CK203_051703 [Vitis vinifera]|uniref:Uncharacterized protein n=1 Tax=Vitis vinifera TaxID=29760 RepID=A0A438H4R6_VITVI|nr:hypothetical protein CK203_051703 [Vitis vinifera]